MKDILESIYTYGPKFLSEFMGIVSGPKTFIRELDFNAADLLSRAIVFFVLCKGTTFILELPFLSISNELWSPFLVGVILFATGIILTSALLKASFRVVGGRGLFSHFFLVTIYVSAPTGIFHAFFAAASKGMVLTDAPDLYPLFKEHMDQSMSLSFQNIDFNKFMPLYENTTAMIAVLFSVSIMVLISFWSIVCWGGYRHISGITKFRSFVAFIIFSILSIPLGYLFVMAQRGLGVNLF